MELQLQTIERTPVATVGRLSEIQGDTVIDLAYTLEDAIRRVKIKNETCIPEGTYDLAIRRDTPMANYYDKRFKDDGVVHDGMLWLLDVPNYTNVYIHIGNYTRDTAGCILVGTKYAVDADVCTVQYSKVAYLSVYPRIHAAVLAGDCRLTVIR